ncbi:MAG: DUF2252 domain-containing protein [Propionibacteriaceae bacterium]|nr:DUF2252 domain-containing protein [Propionibacteriaceae bacterium]
MTSLAALDALAELPQRRRDPLVVIAEQNANRLPDLVGVRMSRMVTSPFALFRGSAAQMASDLSRTPNSGIRVLSCGDAHLSNFGFHTPPERVTRFDLNEFDEGGMAPWEWDVKRLVASVHLAVLDQGAPESTALDAGRVTAKAYRKAIRRLHQMSPVDRFHARMTDRDLARLASTRDQRKALAHATERPRTPESAQVLTRLVLSGNGGRRRIIDQPPLTRHTDDATHDELEVLWQRYVAATREEVRYLLGGYTLVDHVLRVVGVRSVGLRCYIVLLEDAHGDPLFLQVKQATPSVLASHGRIDQTCPAFGFRTGDDLGDGFRVVAAQRVLQATPDPFLGWVRGRIGDQGETDFYWRQFRDTRGSVDLSRLDADGTAATARVCAGLLARAHAQSPDLDGIAEFCALGAKRLDRLLANFGRRYASLVRHDFETVSAAAAKGAVPLTRP